MYGVMSDYQVSIWRRRMTSARCVTDVIVTFSGVNMRSWREPVWPVYGVMSDYGVSIWRRRMTSARCVTNVIVTFSGVNMRSWREPGLPGVVGAVVDGGVADVKAAVAKSNRLLLRLTTLFCITLFGELTRKSSGHQQLHWRASERFYWSH